MNSVIIVAGGKGERMNSATPKQFILLNGLPILMHSIKKFYDYSADTNIIVALPGDYIVYWQQLCLDYGFKIPHQVVCGGNSRSQSVRQGLMFVPNSGLVAVHDAVRPLVSISLIRELFSKAETVGNIIPVTDINDSIRYVNGNENKSIDRYFYKTVQTPQVFKSDFLKLAYSLDIIDEFSDDASLIESLNIKINTIEGEQSNIKITHKTDIIIAEAILNMSI